MEVTRLQLFRQVWARPMGKVAGQYGLTGNGLAKICDRLAIPRPTRSHWTRQEGAREIPPALPPAPLGLSETFALGPRQSRQSPGARTRLSNETRREQLLDVARTVALKEGVSAVTTRGVAQAVGISETQVHNFFGSRTNMLAALARREIEGQESRRQKRVARGTDRVTRVVLSTVGYLHGAARSGPLLQMLLRVPEVRESLKNERYERANAAHAPILKQLVRGGGMDLASARASTVALTAVALKAGGIVASKRAPFALVEEICLSIVLAGMQSDERIAQMEGPAG